MRWQSFIYSCDYSQDTATQPGRFSGPLHPFPIWSYSEWGLPSQVITYLLVRSYRTVPPLPDKSGGTLFCGTIPKVSLAGRYPAFRPMELGLSSPPANPKIHRRRDCLSHSRVYRSTAVFPCQGCLKFVQTFNKVLQQRL